MKNCAKAALDCQQHSVLRIDENLSPVSLDSVVIAESDHPGNGRYTGASPITSVGCLQANQVNKNSKVRFIALLGELTLSWTSSYLTVLLFFQLIQDVHSMEPRNDFTESFYVPVFAMLPVSF